MSTSDVPDKIIAKAWQDPAFKAKLKADPGAVLKDLGVNLPSGIKVHVVENTPTDTYLVLPLKPGGELSDEALDKVAGGHHQHNCNDPGWGHKI